MFAQNKSKSQPAYFACTCFPMMTVVDENYLVDVEHSILRSASNFGACAGMKIFLSLSMLDISIWK
jgi:hypothetical protein